MDGTLETIIDFYCGSFFVLCIYLFYSIFYGKKFVCLHFWDLRPNHLIIIVNIIWINLIKCFLLCCGDCLGNEINLLIIAFKDLVAWNSMVEIINSLQELTAQDALLNNWKRRFYLNSFNLGLTTISLH